ncbi:MAG: YicC/YloC family endoribonuclease [Terriglobia bacterium]
MPIRSMTGFARVSRALPEGELTLSIKSVNHRGLDLHFHMPMEFDAIEPAMRSTIRKTVSRGHVQIQVHFKRTGDAGGPCAVNEPLLRAWLDSFRDLAARFELDSKPDLNQALRLPGMLETRSAAGAADASVEAAALTAAAEAVAELDRFRLREGEAVEADIRQRAGAIREITDKMAEIREVALPQFQQRLRDRLEELLNGSLADPARIVQEAAMLAERSDICEELVRLRTHSGQVGSLLAAGGEIGKKLDFLLQEMNRETNTILSKTGGPGEHGLRLTDLGLAAKAEIDRIREQSLNIE